jgi:hypothetical protein
MPFRVITYGVEQLVSLLAEKATASTIEVAQKKHIDYLTSYFAELDAKTIVVELDYIDHDYLEDYSNYYVKCFYDYHRKCARLHFFQESFSSEDFSRVMASENEELLDKIKKTYLGFIVVKPLPKTIIGRSCLKTYPAAGARHYPVTRKYSANLFGIELEVSSLAYQEQDTVAAACATSALWSVFHGTGMLFHHAIPSPIEITKAALEKSPAEERNLPNKGLNVVQLGHAIRHVGLDPYLVKATNAHILKGTAYAYLRAGIPVYFSIRLYGPSKISTESRFEFIGGHGVAIGGYKTESPNAQPMVGTGFLLRASRIDKLYVHDDQVGPFAWMGFDTEDIDAVQPNDPQRSSISLSGLLTTSWFGGAGRALPNAILISLHYKIRISYDIIHDIVLEFDSILELLRPQFLEVLTERIEWDIFLSQVNSFKSELLESVALGNGLKESVLTEKMPRYIWRAIGTVDMVNICQVGTLLP